MGWTELGPPSGLTRSVRGTGNVEDRTFRTAHKSPVPVRSPEKLPAVTMQSMGAPDGKRSTTVSPTTPMSSLTTGTTLRAL